MKIAIVTNLYPPRARGGAEIIAETMALGFAKQGHTVVVLTTAPYSSLRSLRPSMTVQQGIQVYSWYPLNFYHYTEGNRKPWVLRALWHIVDICNLHSKIQAQRILEREQPDLVITHNLMGMGFLIPTMLHRSKMRHVHVLHDVQLYNPSGIIRLGEERSLSQFFYTAVGYPALMRYLFRKTSLVVSPSCFLLDFYRRHGFFNQTRSVVIQNPVSFTGHEQHQPMPGVLRLLYVGQLSESKGAIGLVNVVLHGNDPALSLTLIGDGSDMPALRTQAAASHGRISILGRLPHETIPTHFAQADILVAPTLCYDTFPTIVAESLRCGLPVIISDLGGAKEVVEEGVTGWIVPAGAWDQLGSLLKKLSVDRESIARAAARATASVAHLTADRYIDELLKELRT